MSITGATLRFQSTLPARGATFDTAEGDAAKCISIHAPRTGSDVSKCQMLINPLISIHAPRTGSDVSTFYYW